MNFSYLRSLLIIMVVMTMQVEACTGIMLKAKDGSYVQGRTLEFGSVVQTSAMLVPRGYEFVGTTPRGEGLKYKAKYAAIGAISFDDYAIMDGLNEKGLAVGVFYFPGFAGYTEINSANQSKALSPVEFSNWIITQFATVDEVKAALGRVVIAPTVNKKWGSSPPPFHYIVYDKRGNALVIEPIDGKLVTYDNPFGSFTNSPTFDWHTENLRNYINLTDINVNPIKLAGVTLAPFGQGSGMVGLPGDFTPPSRFIRATIFSQVALPSKDSTEAVYQAFHILNQFDIPLGAVEGKKGRRGESEFTQVTCVRDPQTLKYYFRTYEDQTIKVIDFGALDKNGKKLKIVPSSGEERAINITKKFD